MLVLFSNLIRRVSLATAFLSYLLYPVIELQSVADTGIYWGEGVGESLLNVIDIWCLWIIIYATVSNFFNSKIIGGGEPFWPAKYPSLVTMYTCNLKKHLNVDLNINVLNVILLMSQGKRI